MVRLLWVSVALGIGLHLHRLHLFESRPPALVRGRDAHGFAVLGNRATRHRNALGREQFRDAPVAQGSFRVLVLDELADLGADGGGGGAGTVGAFDLAGEEVAQLEHAARRVHVLAGSDARHRRLVHRDRFGDVLENHRPHVLLAVLEERRLALDDGAGDLHEGFVADLQALEQPARLLQLRAHAGVAGVAPDEAGVALIEPHTWQRRRVDLHAPAPLGAAHEHIGHHVLRAVGAHGGARARMAGAHQGERRGELLLGGAQLTAQQRQLTLGDQLHVLARDWQRGADARRSRIQLPQLQLDALTDRTRADARRVEGLYPAEHAVHFLRRALELRAQRVHDFLERFGEIDVVADGINDGAPHREFPRCQARELQLPHQVILQRLTAGVGVFLLTLVLVAASWGFGRSHAVLAPAVVEH